MVSREEGRQPGSGIFSVFYFLFSSTQSYFLRSTFYFLELILFSNRRKSPQEFHSHFIVATYHKFIASALIAFCITGRQMGERQRSAEPRQWSHLRG